MRGAKLLLPVGLLLFGAIVGWALAVVFIPKTEESQDTAVSYVKARQGEIEDTLKVSATASWRTNETAVNRATGIVTSIPFQSGDIAENGTIVYTVNMRPSVLAQGNIPSYRDLEPGSSGEDVRQLQSMLKALQHLNTEPTGSFDSKTGQAVKRWQKTMGLQESGIVLAGDLVFLPTVPARITLDAESLRVGATLSGGEKVVNGLSSTPVFELRLTPEQARLVDTGTKVVLHPTPEHSWSAQTAETRVDKDKVTVNLQSETPDAQICADNCDVLQAGADVQIRAEAVRVPKTGGILVPSTAIAADATQKNYVTDRQGKRHPVTLVASARGMTAVTGIKNGLAVRVFGSADGKDG